MNRQNRNWTEDEIHQMKILFELGYSAQKIANEMGRSLWSIRVKLAREGCVYHKNQYTQYIRVKDLAVLFGVSDRIMYIYGEKMDSFRIGREVYVTPENFERWLLHGYADYFLQRGGYKPTIKHTLQKYSKASQSENAFVTRDDIANAFMVSNQQISHWQRYKNFPEPIITPTGHYWYYRLDVENWAVRNARGYGRW